MPPRRQPSQKVREVVAPYAPSDPCSQTLVWLARLLRGEGVDLLQATFTELRRGTPVYVDADAEVLEVQRLMARNHIRSVPVLDGDCVLGILDLVDLAMMDHRVPGA